MATTLFPLISGPEEAPERQAVAMPLYREVKWDHRANRPMWHNGAPVWATGAEAVSAWVSNALHTERRARDIFTHDYGLELRALAGKPFSESVRQSEGVRYIKEALEINPYITAVRQVEVDFTGSTLTLTCAVDTIYGEVTVHEQL